MEEIDESYRVIRPRHQERLSRRAEREAAGRRNRIVLSALVGIALVVIVVVAVFMGGSGSKGDETVSAGDGPEDRSADIGTPTNSIDGADDRPGTDVTVEPATTVVDPDDTAETPADGSDDGAPDASNDPDTDDPSTEGGAGDPVEAPPATEPPGPATGTIVRSCGASEKGDCRIAVRSGPSTSDKAVGRMSEGDTAVFVCTVTGEEVRSTVLGETTAVWARNERGNYVSMAYLDVPGWDVFETTRPC